MSVTDTRPRTRSRGLPESAPNPRRWAYYALALLAAWLVPVVTHLLRVDIVLVPLTVVATASVLRTGGTLVDRLMLAVLLDSAMAITAGIGFTFWPWGLQPVPVTGCALTGLVLYAMATNTRPRLPLRVGAADLVIPGTWLAGAYVALAPVLRSSAVNRVGYTLIDNDRLHHFNLFDSIRSIGGFTMLNFEPARYQVADGMGRNYPPGAHYLYALLDEFVMSGRPAGDPIHETDRYFVYVALGFGFLAASIVWGAKWIAGPAVRGWRTAFVTSVIGAVAATGFLTTLVWEGFDSEAVGLAFLALAIAVIIRPARGLVTQTVFAGAGIICVSFSYTLMLVFIVPAVIAVAVMRRRTLLKRWRPILAIGLVSGAVTMIPIVAPHLNSGFDTTSMYLYGGFVATLPRSILYTTVALAFGGILVSRTARRSPVMRLTAIVLACGVLATVALYKYVQTNGGGDYYFEKTIHGLFIVALVCAGSAAYGLRVDAFTDHLHARRPGLPSRAVAGLAIIAAGVLVGGGISFGKTTYDRATLTPGADTTWASVWDDGSIYVAPYAKTVDRLRQEGYINGAGGKPTMVIVDNDAGINQSLTLISATLNRNMGMVVMQEQLWDSTYWLIGLPAKGPLPAKSQHSLDLLEGIIKSAPFPMRIVVADDRLESILKQLAAENPSLQLEVDRY